MNIDMGRFEKGLRVFRAGLVERTGDFSFAVRSESNGLTTYRVNNQGCTCADSQMRQVVCKHMVASGIYFACSMWIPLTVGPKNETAQSFKVELPAIKGLTISIHQGRATVSFG